MEQKTDQITNTPKEELDKPAKAPKAKVQKTDQEILEELVTEGINKRLKELEENKKSENNNIVQLINALRQSNEEVRNANSHDTSRDCGTACMQSLQAAKRNSSLCPNKPVSAYEVVDFAFHKQDIGRNDMRSGIGSPFHRILFFEEPVGNGMSKILLAYPRTFGMNHEAFIQTNTFISCPNGCIVNFKKQLANLWNTSYASVYGFFFNDK